jgi:hypothetical protein
MRSLSASVSVLLALLGGAYADLGSGAEFEKGADVTCENALARGRRYTFLREGFE